MNYRWDWSILFKETYMGWLWSGLLWTVIISLASWAVALMVGLLAGTARSSPSRGARLVAGLYIDVFRNEIGRAHV